MVHNSKARTRALISFLLEEVIENQQAYEVSDVKQNGTVFVRFRSVTEAAATASACAFQDALEAFGARFQRPEEHKFRLALEQFG